MVLKPTEIEPMLKIKTVPPHDILISPSRNICRMGRTAMSCWI